MVISNSSKWNGKTEHGITYGNWIPPRLPTADNDFFVQREIDTRARVSVGSAAEHGYMGGPGWLVEWENSRV